MKAKEYFAKYDERIISKIRAGEDECNDLKDLLFELNDESKELIKLRKVQSNAGVVGVIREINDKWNAISNMFEKKYGASPLKHDGFKNFWCSEIPEMKDYFNPKR